MQRARRLYTHVSCPLCTTSYITQNLELLIINLCQENKIKELQIIREDFKEGQDEGQVGYYLRAKK